MGDHVATWKKVGEPTPSASRSDAARGANESSSSDTLSSAEPRGPDSDCSAACVHGTERVWCDCARGCQIGVSIGRRARQRRVNRCESGLLA